MVVQPGLRAGIDFQFGPLRAYSRPPVCAWVNEANVTRSYISFEGVRICIPFPVIPPLINARIPGSQQKAGRG